MSFTSIVSSFIIGLVKRIPTSILLRYLESGERAVIDGLKAAPEKAAFIKQLVKPFLGYLERLTPEFVIETLRKHDIEKAGIILNHSNGIKFLNDTITDIKLWLTDEDILCEACGNPFPNMLLNYTNYTCPYCQAKYEKKKS